MSTCMYLFYDKHKPNYSRFLPKNSYCKRKGDVVVHSSSDHALHTFNAAVVFFAELILVVCAHPLVNQVLGSSSCPLVIL